MLDPCIAPSTDTRWARFKRGWKKHWKKRTWKEGGELALISLVATAVLCVLVAILWGIALLLIGAWKNSPMVIYGLGGFFGVSAIVFCLMWGADDK